MKVFSLLQEFQGIIFLHFQHQRFSQIPYEEKKESKNEKVWQQEVGKTQYQYKTFFISHRPT